MSSQMTFAYDLETLRATVGDWKAKGLRTAVVPTMGALHDGHLELVRRGVRLADRLVVTVFINPKQFGEHEDLDKYPRDLAGDKQKLEQAGANLVFIPDDAVMYPEGFSTLVSLSGPGKAGLDDKFRPQFFDGVATVVAKLLNQASYDYAMFGEKDFQQLAVVTQMVRDLNIPTTISPVETIREPSGLAMASRNAYLTDEELKIAPAIYENMQQAAEEIRGGETPLVAVQQASEILQKLGFKIDYVEARNARTLKPAQSNQEPVRILAAGWLGKTRLIDNIGV